MIASDFILQAKADLQEKSEHWKPEELLVKLQRAYISLQFDLPYFIIKQEIVIKEGTTDYFLDYKVLKNVSFKLNEVPKTFMLLETFYEKSQSSNYSLQEKMLYIGETPLVDMSATLVYKYEKRIETINCEIELPSKYDTALRLLFMSRVHEKPTRNTKERNLSTHYLKLYNLEVQKIKRDDSVRAKNVTSNYQKV